MIAIEKIMIKFDLVNMTPPINLFLKKLLKVLKYCATEIAKQWDRLKPKCCFVTQKQLCQRRKTFVNSVSLRTACIL